MVLEMKIIKEELRFEENLKTSSAKELAKKNNVLLWDRNKIKELINNLHEHKKSSEHMDFSVIFRFVYN